MPKTISAILANTLVISAAISCSPTGQNGQPDGSDGDGSGPGNERPVADAGSNQLTWPGRSVLLDGSASYDPNGDELSYLWTQADGPRVDLDDYTTAAASFVAPAVFSAELVFELVVSDGEMSSAPARVTVSVSARARGFADNPLQVTARTSGHASVVFVQAEIAYVGTDGAGLEIFDLSDPQSPSRLGGYDPGQASFRDVQVAGPYAYVVDGSRGLLVLDVSNPAAPVLVGSHDTSGDATGLYLAGGYAYLTDGEFGLHILDIGDPASPALVGTFDTPGYAQDVYVAGAYAYVADNVSLQVVDVSDPAAPAYAGSRDTPSAATGVQVVGDVAYVVDYEVAGGALAILDVSNPSAPSALARYEVGDAAHDVFVTGAYAYFAYYGGLDVLEVSNSAAPALAGRYGLHGAYGVHVVGDYAYVADYDRLSVIDVRVPVLPATLGSADTSAVTDSYFSSLQVANGHAWMLYGDSLVATDITDPAAPEVVGSCDLPGGRDLLLAGERAFVAADSFGLHVVDITTPATPALLGSYALPAVAVGAAGSATCVGSDGDIQLWELGELPVPALLGVAATAGWAYDVDVEGDHAYVAAGLEGLQVLDVGDPAAPAIVGSYSPADAAFIGVQVAGGRVYLRDPGVGVRIVDVSDPAAPVLAGTIDGRCYDFDVDGANAFVVDGENLSVLDLSDPSAPALVAQVACGALAIEVVGGHAYALDHLSGLEVYDVSLPGTPAHVGGLAIAGYSHLAVADGLALAWPEAYGDFADRAAVIDVRDPAAPVFLGSWDSQSLMDPIADMAIAGGRAVISTGGRGGSVRVLDIADPTAPVLVGQYWTPGQAGGVRVLAGRAYVADGETGIYLFDVDDYEPAQLLGTCEIIAGGYKVADVEVAGDHAYVLARDRLCAVDITDTGAPSVVGCHTGLQWGRGLDVAGGYAYVTDFDSDPELGLWIIDVHDPAEPFLASSFRTPGRATGVRVAGDSAYVTSADLLVVDVSDPASPYLAAAYLIPGGAGGVDIAGDTACVANGDGLHVIALQRLSLGPDVEQAAAGSTQSYSVSWPAGPTVTGVRCTATGGACRVTSLDLAARTAAIDWTLPDAPGGESLVVAVGNWNYFTSARDDVEVQ